MNYWMIFCSKPTNKHQFLPPESVTTELPGLSGLKAPVRGSARDTGQHEKLILFCINPFIVHVNPSKNSAYTKMKSKTSSSMLGCLD